jgi:hypothetical protein
MYKQYMEARTLCNTTRQVCKLHSFLRQRLQVRNMYGTIRNYRKYTSIRNIDHNSYVPYLQFSHNLICYGWCHVVDFLSSDHLLSFVMAQALWTTVLFYNYFVDKKILNHWFGNVQHVIISWKYNLTLRVSEINTTIC